jgi:hypothetical protein
MGDLSLRQRDAERHRQVPRRRELRPELGPPPIPLRPVTLETEDVIVVGVAGHVDPHVHLPSPP